VPKRVSAQAAPAKQRAASPPTARGAKGLITPATMLERKRVPDFLVSSPSDPSQLKRREDSPHSESRLRLPIRAALGPRSITLPTN